MTSMPSAGERPRRKKTWIGLTIGCALAAGIVAILGCGGLLLGWYGLSHRQETLVDETRDATTGTYWFEHFTLNKQAQLSVALDVTDGPAVNCYVMDQKDKEAFDSANNALLGGQFHYVSDLSRQSVRSYTSAATISPGDWNVVVVPVGSALLAPAQTSTFHVKVTVQP